jgi:hypothetical protein
MNHGYQFMEGVAGKLVCYTAVATPSSTMVEETDASLADQDLAQVGLPIVQTFFASTRFAQMTSFEEL